jgi:hypothetical protein
VRQVRNATLQRKLVLATVASCIVFGTVHGFAASLGAATTGLGATNKLIASCGTGMTFAYTTGFYNGTSGYAVNSINLSDIPAGCLSKHLYVTFYDSSNNASGSPVSATLPASGTTQSISITPSSNTIDADEISGVSVVVS